MNKDFYVITGGPGVGKTALLKELSSHGYQTVQEDARRIIRSEIETNSEGLPWKNKELYATLMLEESIKSYEKEEKKKNLDITFFDRGILDAICYMKMEKLKVSFEVTESVKQYPYNKTVFLLPPWKEIYKTDNERKQNWNEAEATFSKMKETYIEYGYDIIEVPKRSVEERAKFVIQCLK